MASFQLKTSIALIVLSFIMGFCSSFLLNGCNQTTIGPGIAIVPPKNLQEQVDNKEKQYQAEITKLQIKNAGLQQEVEITEGLLQQAKQVTMQKEIKIKKLLKPTGFPARELLKKAGDSTDISTDNTERSCDSLMQEVSGYMQENKIKDSLYEAKIICQDSLINLKDKIIEQSSKMHDELKRSFDKSMEQQNILLAENSNLKKRFKQQKLKQKLITIGLLIISGIGTNYFLHQ